MKAQILVSSGVDICSEETFGYFSQMWYDMYKKPYLRENSLIAIRNTLNQHILPVIGGYRLRDISPMHVQAIMAGLASKSNSLQSKVLIALRSIFKVAVENGLIAKTPVSSMLKAGGQKSQEKDIISSEERAKLLEQVKNPRARTFLLIALHTGMRRGEILGLTWDNIDFQKKMIYVRKSALLGRDCKETAVNDYLKTEAGKRDIPLSEELEAWLRKEKKVSHSKYVLAMRNHKPLTQSAYRSMWKLI